MTASKPPAELLRSLGHLSEWLLHDVRWRRFGSEIEVQFNNVFDESIRVRTDALDNPRLFVVRLFGVQSLTLSNHLSPAMLDEPERIDWGFSEISKVDLQGVALADRVGVRFSILWEGPRRIDVIAASIEVADVFGLSAGDAAQTFDGS